MDTTLSIKVLPILLGLFGGLALFLFGLEQMTNALKGIAGNRLKKIFSRLTSNRIKGAFSGAFITSIIQSSSITTVLVVGFISAGLINLKQAISVIMGAHVGTTITVQIIAFKVTELSYVMIIIGVGLKLLVKQDKIKNLGFMILGLGLIFLGMNLMSDSTYPLRSYQPFLDLMRTMENPILGILAATIFTAIIQTSAATIGIVITLASQGFISLEAGIALTFGANIGTCITAILASIGTSREGKQAAFSHVVVNLIGVIIWVPFIYYLAQFVSLISPSFPNLSGINRVAAEAPRQIANAHTIFNVVNTLLFLPFITPLAKFIGWILPLKPVEEPQIIKPKYINNVYLRTPSIALDRVRMELFRQAKRAFWMVREIPVAFRTDSKEKLKLIRKMDNEVDALHEIIINFLGKLSKEELTNQESNLLQAYIAAANYIENIGDVVETNLYSLGKERLKTEVDLSESFDKYLNPYFEKVIFNLDESLKALMQGDKAKAQNVIEAKSEISELADNALDHLSSRLHKEKNLDLAEFRIQTDIIENFRRIYYLAKRVAKVVSALETSNKTNGVLDLQERLPFDES
jgi:phosphate:Na+ symporter